MMSCCGPCHPSLRGAANLPSERVTSLGRMPADRAARPGSRTANFRRSSGDRSSLQQRAVTIESAPRAGAVRANEDTAPRPTTEGRRRYRRP
jgi:hypothetical protein